MIDSADTKLLTLLDLAEAHWVGPQVGADVEDGAQGPMVGADLEDSITDFGSGVADDVAASIGEDMLGSAIAADMPAAPSIAADMIGAPSVAADAPNAPSIASDDPGAPSIAVDGPFVPSVAADGPID